MDTNISSLKNMFPIIMDATRCKPCHEKLRMLLRAAFVVWLRFSWYFTCQNFRSGPHRGTNIALGVVDGQSRTILFCWRNMKILTFYHSFSSLVRRNLLLSHMRCFHLTKILSGSSGLHHSCNHFDTKGHQWFSIKTIECS